ncbi:hypothetical protein CHLNCDRAFT_34979 [Chlorella variabilis]|uniref:STEEP1 domain-containing protein n=1 Tax=Chlorella variabilis TaxID=554065 RepID=E1ZCD5_CHLVA|nr:hypothetical protein CHLNCDRAFT_34979 [Chlorella variabilis]EFN56584.1 hypothetical protein CHLNCDRAFT_34979 [Chlorella variabilis]|eukprot:XP_005848686.1 hypothetical protein CHLNCDRAFT_34979 [Chlorella variabilis]
MPPRRTTLTYSSEDVGPVVGDKPLYVYYCKYSGKHAMTTDCNLSKAPRRATDHALVLDTQEHMVKLYTQDGGAKLLRRRNGNVERQLRLCVGKLPVAYRTEPEGRFLYVLDNALTTYTADESGMGEGKPPVPPCIIRVGKATQVALEVDDRGKRALVLRVTADFVRVQLKSGANAGHANEELLEMLRGVLGVRLGQLSLQRGESSRHKVLLVEGLSPGKSAAWRRREGEGAAAAWAALSPGQPLPAPRLAT